MKRMALILAGVSMFGWGVSGALAGCGGDDGDATIADSDGGGASTSSGGSSSGTASGSSSGGSSTSSSGGTSDGGTDGSSGGDGGGTFTSNPNKITCGATECTAGTQVCCSSQNDAGCVAENMNCGIGSQKIACDEKADCTGAEICCAGFQGNRCDDKCGVGQYQTCKTSTECVDAGTCKEWTCTLGGGGGGGGTTLKLRACEKPFNNCQ